MNYFNCCRHCEPPKRYPGCAGSCDEYKSERKRYDADKAKERESIAVDLYVAEKYATSRDYINKRSKDYPGVLSYKNPQK